MEKTQSGLARILKPIGKGIAIVGLAAALATGCYYNPYLPQGIVITSDKKYGKVELDYTIANANIYQVDVHDLNYSFDETIYLKSRGDSTTGSYTISLLEGDYALYSTEFITGTVLTNWPGPSANVTVKGGQTITSSMNFDNPF